MTDLPTFTMERIFDAPGALVWKTWTDPGLLARWYGPGVETVIHELDVRPGGVWLNEMRMSKGSGYQRADFTEVDEARRLAFIQSNTDADWQVAANPMMPDWPRKLMTVITFEESDGKTRMQLDWTPHEASEAEIAMFTGAMAGLDRGWGAGFDMLGEMLAELQS